MHPFVHVQVACGSCWQVLVQATTFIGSCVADTCIGDSELFHFWMTACGSAVRLFSFAVKKWLLSKFPVFDGVRWNCGPPTCGAPRCQGANGSWFGMSSKKNPKGLSAFSLRCKVSPGGPLPPFCLFAIRAVGSPLLFAPFDTAPLICLLQHCDIMAVVSSSLSLRWLMGVPPGIYSSSIQNIFFHNGSVLV